MYYTPEAKNADKGKTIVGNDVWIGSDCVIMRGITIGDGAVIGAGSIVTKDIPPYAIAVGNPAHVIKYRFDDETIRMLMQIKWWDWEENKLRNAASHMHYVDDFLHYVDKTE